MLQRLLGLTGCYLKFEIRKHKNKAKISHTQLDSKKQVPA